MSDSPQPLHENGAFERFDTVPEGFEDAYRRQLDRRGPMPVKWEGVMRSIIEEGHNGVPVAIDHFGRAYERGESPWQVVEGFNRMLTLQAWYGGRFGLPNHDENGKVTEVFRHPQRTVELAPNPGDKCDACGESRTHHPRKAIHSMKRIPDYEPERIMLYYDLNNGKKICEGCADTTGSHLPDHGITLNPDDWPCILYPGDKA